MEEVHDLWKASYFDYVIDVRTYDDLDAGDGVILSGSGLLPDSIDRVFGWFAHWLFLA
jgi:hypothetical protein